MVRDITQLNPTQIYHIMAQTIIPRPIAWIVTENNGVINIAPFSFFAPLSANPATLMVSIGYKDKEKTIEKDTLANIKNTQKCTLCVVDEHHLEKMHKSSQSLPKDQSEAQHFDIQTKTIQENFPPMIENASVAYMCSFNQAIDLGKNSTVPIILNVENIFIDDKNITTDENKEFIQFDPVARIGREYAFLGQKIAAPQ